jgi:Peptidase family M28
MGRLRGLSAPLRYLAYFAVALLVLVVAVGVGATASLVFGGRPEWLTSDPGATEGTMSAQQIAEAVRPQIDEASIREHLSHLTGASPAPLEGAPTIAERESWEGRLAAARYMEQSFEEMGLPARILEFTSEEGSGYNVEATLHGSGAEKHLWVTAHLDSVVGTAGANDNASGLTLLLMTARVLKHLELKHTVHFVAYDLEERGKLGSNDYVSTVVDSEQEREGREAIIGNINADMVGYEENEWNAFIETCDLSGSLDEALTQAAKAIDPPVALGEGCPEGLAGRSDHVLFREAGLPAVLLIDGTKADDYPCYHERCDTMDKLNVAYLQAMIRIVATASALLAHSAEAH